MNEQEPKAGDCSTETSNDAPASAANESTAGEPLGRVYAKGSVNGPLSQALANASIKLQLSADRSGEDTLIR